MEFDRAMASRQGLVSGFGQALGAAENVATREVPTLASALASLAKLNGILSETAVRAEQLATAIGGPIPCPVVGGGDYKDANKPSAIQQLNDDLATAHGRVQHLIASISAMQRSLGA